MDDSFVIQSGREIRTETDWRDYAGPKKGQAQWAHGRSAMESARAWLRPGEPAVPEELSALLESCEHTADFRPLYAIPELVTRLDEFGGEHRNHDLVVVGTARGGRTLLGIEAKADEEFGSMDVGPYLVSTGRKVGSNVPKRIRRLVGALFGPDALEGDQVAGTYASLRYQLISALAGTLIEARRRFAEQAVLLVQFTSASDQRGGYVGTKQRALDRNAEGWEAFVSALGAASARGQGRMVGPLRVPGSDLVPADLPFFLGKATVDLGDEPTRRWAADRALASSTAPETNRESVAGTDA